MPAEAPFLFSIAGLSASFAGLAGLVAGLRRGSDLRQIDQFRLRQIVEFSFVNIGLAIGYFPIATILADDITARRVLAVAAFVFVVGQFAVLRSRSLATGVRWTGTWRVAAALVTIAVLAAAVALVAWPTAGALEILLLALLARPMLAFSLVLGSMETAAPR